MLGSSVRRSAGRLLSAVRAPSSGARACAAGASLVGAAVLFHGSQTANADSAVSSPFTFGWGLHGQLGHGDEADRAVPTPIKPLRDTDFKQATAAGNCICLLAKDGSVWTSGLGRHGRLGHGDETSITVPNQVVGLENENVLQVACAEHHMAAVTEKGDLFVWGHYRSIGMKERELVLSPVRVEVGHAVASVDVGHAHSAIVTTTGKLLTYGTGGSRQLGHGENEDGIFEDVKICADGSKKPKEVEGLTVKAVQAACGVDFTVVLTEDGNVYTFGNDDDGQCGQGGGARHKEVPTLVQKLAPHKVVKVAAGERHALAITDKGELFTWGLGSQGQLGHGATADVSRPRLVEALKGKRVRDAACGQGHTAVVLDDGALYLFGRGRHGQLGRGDQNESLAFPRPEPLYCEALSGFRVSSVGLGIDHSVVIAAPR